MKRFRWHQYLTINLGWLGLAMTSGSMTPLILPYMVQLFVGDAVKNTFYGQLRFFGLMVAILVQPLAGMLSDRCKSPLGRRGPFILGGAVFSAAFVGLLGMATGFWGLFAVSLMQQAASNTAHGALQGLIPDLVPEKDRVQASGVKAIMELLPIVLVSFTVAPLLDADNLVGALLVVIGSILLGLGATALAVREERLTCDEIEPIGPRLARTVLLMVTFMVIVQGFLRGAFWLGERVTGPGVAAMIALGAAGLVAILGSIILGVWASVRVGVGKMIERSPAFTWWVINRLLFLAAVGAIQGFAFYFVQDVLHMANPARVTANLMMVVGALTVISALLSGRIAGAVGRLRLLVIAGILAAVGAVLLVLSKNIGMVYVSGGFIGLATGLFMATNWAVGTDLVPEDEAGRFLGISNLAGAGAGAIGNGIGGPLADEFNAFQPGLGYLVVLGIFALCFVLSSVVIARVKKGAPSLA